MSNVASGAYNHSSEDSRNSAGESSIWFRFVLAFVFLNWELSSPLPLNKHFYLQAIALPLSTALNRGLSTCKILGISWNPKNLSIWLLLLIELLCQSWEMSLTLPGLKTISLHWMMGSVGSTATYIFVLNKEHNRGFASLGIISGNTSVTSRRLFSQRLNRTHTWMHWQWERILANPQPTILFCE